MTSIRRLAVRIADYANPHLRQIKGLLDQPVAYEAYPEPQLVRECDRVFEERWQRNRRAFLPSFWSDHFEVHSLLRSGILEGTHGLDFGCGTGNIALELARHGHHITGIDRSPKGIRIAHYQRSLMPPEVQRRVSFVCADIKTYQAAAPFDCCYILHVLEHIVDPSFIFTALNRLLRPGGAVWVSVPFATYYDDPSHVHHFPSVSAYEAFLARYAHVRRAWCDERHHVLQALLSLREGQ